MPVTWKRLSLRIACLSLLVSLLGGCASTQNARDPFEPVNRAVYSFNETVDKAVFKPVANAYQAVLPQFVRTSVSNFFGNLNDVLIALNNLLQGKFHAAVSDFGRISINSTLGVLGLFDVASEAGVQKNNEDFGQTLGWWGIGDGPFIMLPILGPSSGRDVVGRIGDFFTDPVTYIDPTRSRNQLRGTYAVNRRAELLDASTILETAALDPYEFMRDAYLQRRRNLIYDGAPPLDREFMDPPPRSQGPAPAKRQSLIAAWLALPSPGEAPYHGSVLVSGDAATPVLSPVQQEATPRRAPAAPQADQASRLTRLWRAIQP